MVPKGRSPPATASLAIQTRGEKANKSLDTPLASVSVHQAAFPIVLALLLLKVGGQLAKLKAAWYKQILAQAYSLWAVYCLIFGNSYFGCHGINRWLPTFAPNLQWEHCTYLWGGGNGNDGEGGVVSSSLWRMQGDSEPLLSTITTHFWFSVERELSCSMGRPTEVVPCTFWRAVATPRYVGVKPFL